MQSPSHEEVLATLRQIIRRIDLYSKKLVGVYGLTGPQLIVLRELGRAEETPVGHLARLIDLSHPTVTHIVDRLEKRGLVVRTKSSADKRRVLVRVTETGITALASAPPLLQEQFVRQFQKLEPWERTQILASLQRVATMMGASGIDASHALIEEPLTEPVQETIAAMSIAPVAGNAGDPHPGNDDSNPS